MNQSVTCVIFARNRAEKTSQLLSSLVNQKDLPLHVLLIENTSESQAFNQSKINKIFANTPVRTHYKNVHFKNVAESRQLALEMVKTDIAIFLDQDVVVDADYISKIKKCFLEIKRVTALVGPVHATDNSISSMYGSIFCNHAELNVTGPTVIPLYGMAAVSFWMPQVRKLGLCFDTSLDTGEDVDFFLTLKEKGGQLFYIPTLCVQHDFRKKDFITHLKRYYEYAQNFLELEQKHPELFSYSHFLPRRKLHWLLFPFYFGYNALQQTEFDIPKKYWLMAIFVHLAITFGVYNSVKGRKLLKKNFKRSWSLTLKK